MNVEMNNEVILSIFFFRFIIKIRGFKIGYSIVIECYLLI